MSFTQQNSGPVSSQPAAQIVTGITAPQAAHNISAALHVAPQAAAHMQAEPDMGVLAVQIAAKASEGNRQFDIRLDPPELGRVEVKLSIDEAGRAQAHLTVEKVQTLDLMQRDRDGLERALKESGVDLSQNGLNFSLKGQDRQGEQAAAFKGRSRALSISAAAEADAASAVIANHHLAAGSSRLDIRV